MTTRDIVVAGGLLRHQMRQFLNAHGMDWREIRVNTKATERESTFRINGGL